MFDAVDFPYTETFVREAIQNTLDARLDMSRPAVISFRFHSTPFTKQRPFLQEAVEFRRAAKLPIPEEWAREEVSWITIEDFNTKGLDGDLGDRFGNFWNYWLNFGLSNKDGSGRGSKGIGRVTLLIASRLQTVIGFTRRDVDGQTVACGMTMLKAMSTPYGPKSTHAYLASGQNDAASVYKLHSSSNFIADVVSAFELEGYGKAPNLSGLALCIPYPHKDLTPNGILASAVDHFGPAILNGSLEVLVDGKILNGATLFQIATDVAAGIRSEPIKADVARYLKLLQECAGEGFHEIKVAAKGNNALSAHRESEIIRQLQKKIEAGEVAKLKLVFDLTQNGKPSAVSLKIVVSRCPEDRKPVDRLYREGMSLPKVCASAPGDLDVVILIDDEKLATYLNCCEGKAHLDLLQSQEVRAKLEAKGYYPIFVVRNLVKGLPTDIRNLLTPEITEPEIDVFDAFFAIPDNSPNAKKRRGGKPDAPPPPPVPPPPPRVSPFKVHTLANGFSLVANTEFKDWPVNLFVTMAYADGSRSPSWNEFDFRPEIDLTTSAEACQPTYSKNVLTARNCGPQAKIEVVGFDNKREVETRLRFSKNAQNN